MTLDEYAQAADDAPPLFSDGEACAWADGYAAALRDLHDDGYRVVKLGFRPVVYDDDDVNTLAITEELT